MSSNSNHINISRDNYEEYLLLYVDNELTPDQKAAVDAFLMLHPDIQSELELLQSAILPAETISFNKEELFSTHMSLNSIDEQLLLFVDDELSVDEKSQVALRIEEDETTAAQYALLLQTKLDKSESIVYPNKEELYRRTERRFAGWLQMAAAVLIILLGGWFWLQSETTGSTNSGITTPFAVITPKQQVNNTSSSPAVTVKAPASTQADRSEVSTTVPKTVTHTIASANKLAVQEGNSATQQRTEAITTTAENAVTLQRTDVISNTGTTDLASTTPQQIINTSLVTTSSVVRTTYIEPVPPEDNSKGRSPLKGFLRKATRFIERTTGISATNENNELLIANVAVRLD